MRSTTFIAAVLLSASSCTAIPNLTNSTTSSKIIRLPLKRSVLPEAQALPNRALDIPLSNRISDYVVEMIFGTPGNTIAVSIDTAYQETWVYSPQSCEGHPFDCGGAYDPERSTTARSHHTEGLYQFFGDNQAPIRGYHVSDRLNLGNDYLRDDVKLGVATNKGPRYGVMGLGYDTSIPGVSGYPTILKALVDQGAISSHSYSIFLNSVKDGEGSITFGGRDPSYIGQLAYVPMVATGPRNSFSGLHVEWNDLRITTDKTWWYADYPLQKPAKLDTGSSVTYIPARIYLGLYKQFGVTGPDAHGNTYVNCNMPTGQLSFSFGRSRNGLMAAITIDVPFSELAIPVGDGKCRFGLAPDQEGSDSYIFGTSFLRSAYVHVNLDSGRIGLANAHRSSK